MKGSSTRWRILAAAAGVIAAVSCLVLGVWKKHSVAGARVLLWRDAGRALYYTGSSSPGVGYYADLVKFPNETPTEYLEKEAEKEARAKGIDGLVFAHMHARMRPGGQEKNAQEPDLAVWEPISDLEGRYYEDLANNPGETPAEFMQKVGEIGELPRGLLPAAPTGPVSSISAAKNPRIQGLKQVDEDADDDIKQMFHIPDLEQETDGLDLMQDFAPARHGEEKSPVDNANKEAPADAASSQPVDEGYVMHSLRNAFEAKARGIPQILYQQPPDPTADTDPLALPASPQAAALEAPDALLVQEMLKIEAQGARNTDVHPSADVINTYLAGVSVEAEQEAATLDAAGAAAKKRENTKLAHLRKTIAALQDAVLRANPASRGVVARRLSVMKSALVASQQLQDHDSIFLAPYVDDLDNYLQGVLDDVNTKATAPSPYRKIGGATSKRTTTGDETRTGAPTLSLAATRNRQAKPYSNSPTVGEVTYTAETSATPWGVVVDAPANDWIDEPKSRVFEAVGERFGGAGRAWRAQVRQSQLMQAAAEAVPSVTGMGWTSVGGAAGYMPYAAATGPSSSYNYWQGDHHADEQGPAGVYVGAKLGDVFNGLMPNTEEMQQTQQGEAMQQVQQGEEMQQAQQGEGMFPEALPKTYGGAETATQRASNGVWIAANGMYPLI